MGNISRRCNVSGLSAGVEWQNHLGRRRPFDRSTSSVSAWPPPHLDRTCRETAILSDDVLRFLGGAKTLGRFDPRFSFGEYPASCHVRRSPAQNPPRVANSRSWSRGGCFRAAPGSSRIGGVDLRTQEHALGRLLLRRRAGLLAV